MDWKTTLTNLLNKIIDWATTAGVRLLIAIVILFVSFKIINVISKKIENSHKKGKIDKTLAKTFAYVFKIALKIVIAICLVGFVGIDTSGLAALVTSLGVCAGLALNGALSNFAGGVLIILTRPFRVDDYIEAGGHSGTVEDIKITYTRLRTPDNKMVYIPNGSLSADTIVNYSEKETRRVDFNFSISYANDYEKAKNIVLDIFASHDLVLSDPAPMVRVSGHGDSSINLVARAWVKSENYWTVNFDVLELVKSAFDKEGIEIPFNQLDVRLRND